MWMSGDAPASPSASAQFDSGRVHVDFDKFEVKIGDKVHSLTTQEMQLLRYFIAREGKVLSRYDIRLRRIIEANPAEPRHILSVRGTGYRFVAQPNGDRETAPG